MAETISRDDLARTIRKKEAYAKNRVDHYPDNTLEDIVRGKYPEIFSTYSTRRVGVFERASLIVLDARQGKRPWDLDTWTPELLEQRITAMKMAHQQLRDRSISSSVDWQEYRTGISRTRAIAQGKPVDGDKLDDRWS